METIGAVISWVVGSALALGFAMIAMLGVLLPLAPLLLILLLPVALVVVVLRRAGVVRGRFATLAVLTLGVLILAYATDLGWPLSASNLREWVEDNREILEACGARDGAVITLEFKGGPHFGCRFQKKRDTSEDSNI
jgi:hypothetical protein